MGIEVSLFHTVGLGLIVQHSSGIVYTTQMGGNLCRQARMEGVFIGVGNSSDENGRLNSPENDLYKYFTGPPYGGCGALGGLTEEDAAFIDSVLRKYHVPFSIEVDRARLCDSDEAWVYVKVNGDGDFGLFTGLGPYPKCGVLTWSNSD